MSPLNGRFGTDHGVSSLVTIIIIIIIKKGLQCKAGRERFTPYQSQDPNPTIQTHIIEEEKGKTVEEKKGASS